MLLPFPDRFTRGFFWWDLQETPVDVKPSISDGEFCGNQDERVWYLLLFKYIANELDELVPTL